MALAHTLSFFPLWWRFTPKALRPFSNHDPRLFVFRCCSGFFLAFDWLWGWCSSCEQPCCPFSSHATEGSRRAYGCAHVRRLPLCARFTERRREMLGFLLAWPWFEKVPTTSARRIALVFHLLPEGGVPSVVYAEEERWWDLMMGVRS